MMDEPEKFDCKMAARTNILLLKLVGLWPEGVEGYKINVYVVQATVLLITFLFGHVFFQAVNLIFIFNNLEAVTEIIYILLTEILLLFKVYYWVKNMRLLKQLMEILKHDLFQPINTRQVILIQPSLSLWRIIYQALLLMTIGANLFWAVFPILDKSTERRLPFLAWYPYNWKISPLYEITYMYQIISCWYISVVHMNIDTMIAALNMFSGSQVDMLCDNLKNLRKLAGNFSIKANLTGCVEHHKLILSFTRSSNKFFNWIIFLQFFVSGISLGLTMFQLTLVVPFSNQFYSLISYANAVIVQIFMYCWFGNEIQVKSERIPYAVFESDWTDLSQDIRKDLLFLILKTQSPIRISAVNVFNLSLETFMKILKTGWSYFALLNQVNS